ncbi:MAG: hypothetical protein K6E31_02070 [bacterium]|nr:hypothetical protein [bacterium]
MNENELYEMLNRFESNLPTDCGGCETIHRVQDFVNQLTDRFDRRCDDRCDSQCVYGGERQQVK